MLELFPEGFEEVEQPDGIEFAAYSDAAAEERLWQAFGGSRSSEVADDWADRWRRFHRPTCVGGVWIGPPWEQPPADMVSVVVDPGRAFGTGAHPTTRLCLELLQALPCGSLLDVGCGSGVLAIAAAKLGFAPVVAVDVDPVAVQTTRANAAANGVDVDVWAADAVAAVLPRSDTAVANISLPVVTELAPRLPAVHVVTSGYLAGDMLALQGFRRVRRAAADGWAADLHARQSQ